MANTKPSVNFLEFPVEIRLVVYKVLENINSDDKNAEYKTSNLDLPSRDLFGGGFELTRKSLRLTCKQVDEEWTPFFLRSSIICLDSKNDPWHLTDMSMLASPVDKIANIRRIELGAQVVPSNIPTEPVEITLEAQRTLTWLARLLTECEAKMRLEQLTLILYDGPDHCSPELWCYPACKRIMVAESLDSKSLLSLSIFFEMAMACSSRGGLLVMGEYEENVFKIYFNLSSSKLPLSKEQKTVTITHSNLNQVGGGANARKGGLEYYDRVRRGANGQLWTRKIRLKSIVAILARSDTWYSRWYRYRSPRPWDRYSPGACSCTGCPRPKQTCPQAGSKLRYRRISNSAISTGDKRGHKRTFSQAEK